MSAHRVLDGCRLDFATVRRLKAAIPGATVNDAAYQPFSAARVRTATTLNVAFLAEPLAPAAVKVLTAMRTPIDDFHVNGREMLWLCQTRQSESTFSNVRFEKAVGRKATFRGLKTIVKLAAKYSWTHEAP